MKISATYGSKIVDIEWCKKESAKARSDPPKVRKSVYNLVLPILKEFMEVKDRLKAIKEGLMVLQE